MKARDYRLTFGKYRGESLEEIYILDRGYMDWLLETISDKKINFDGEYILPKDLVNQCCSEMRNVKIFS